MPLALGLSGLFCWRCLGRLRPCPPLRSRVSRPGPRPSSPSLAGPRPLRSFPAPSSRSLCSLVPFAPLPLVGAAVALLPWESGFIGAPFCRFPQRAVATLPPVATSRNGRPSRFFARSARPCVSPRLAPPLAIVLRTNARCVLVVCAPRARGCPSLRSRSSRAGALCPHALRLCPPSSLRGLLPSFLGHPRSSSGVWGWGLGGRWVPLVPFGAAAPNPAFGGYRPREGWRPHLKIVNCVKSEHTTKSRFLSK